MNKALTPVSSMWLIAAWVVPPLEVTRSRKTCGGSSDLRARAVAPAKVPATVGLGASFPVADEIYQFKNFARHPLHVLMTLDATSVDASKGARADGDYALAWCRPWGRGRVFYTALGHEPGLWTNEVYLAHVLGGIEWAIRGPDVSEPAPQGATVLFDGATLDTATVAPLAAIIALISSAACYVPALRATRISPTTAMRG